MSIISTISSHYEGEVSDNCELLLYLADRAQHIDTKIFPAINQGVVVVCDRHIDSTVAYQGYGRGLDIEKINLLNNIVTHSRKPDLTLLFDVDTDTASKRVGENKDRLESRKESERIKTDLSLYQKNFTRKSAWVILSLQKRSLNASGFLMQTSQSMKSLSRLKMC